MVCPITYGDHKLLSAWFDSLAVAGAGDHQQLYKKTKSDCTYISQSLCQALNHHLEALLSDRRLQVVKVTRVHSNANNAVMVLLLVLRELEFYAHVSFSFMVS